MMSVTLLVIGYSSLGIGYRLMDDSGQGLSGRSDVRDAGGGGMVRAVSGFMGGVGARTTCRVARFNAYLWQ